MSALIIEDESHPGLLQIERIAPDSPSFLPAIKGEIKEIISNRTARVGGIGLSYVGLPLTVEFAQAGLAAIGFELVGYHKVTRMASMVVDTRNALSKEIRCACKARIIRL